MTDTLHVFAPFNSQDNYFDGANVDNSIQNERLNIALASTNPWKDISLFVETIPLFVHSIMQTITLIGYMWMHVTIEMVLLKI